MLESLTEGARRAVVGAERRALAEDRSLVEPIDLLAALGDDEESLAMALLIRHGLAPDAARAALGVVSIHAIGDLASDPASNPMLSPESRAAIRRATDLARVGGRASAVSTEHLLASLLGPDLDFGPTLEAVGLRLDDLLETLEVVVEEATEPLPIPTDISPLELIAPADAVDLGRVLDASANRAREGLRVIEDYVRFALNDPALTKRLKEVRHRIDEASRGLDPDLLIGSRDVVGDVGAHIMAPPGSARENPRAVVAANFKRAQEALRSLEEFSKLVDGWISGRFEVARYDLYLIEKLVMTAIASARTFDDVRLYVLVGGEATLGDLSWIVGEALAGGADAIQLREKGRGDREVLERAREVRILTAKAGARFIMNDRPDLAKIAGADGVHLGQDDLPVLDARWVLGPRAAIGVSTHESLQIERAVLAGAGYLGVGPVFPSGTKAFEEFVGLGLVRQAAELTSLPWFAIGGIDVETIGEVLNAGASRVAVSGAITRAERPRDAARALRDVLDSSPIA